MIDITPNPGRIGIDCENLINRAEKSTMTDCKESPSTEGVQPADQQESALSTDQLKHALQTEKENSRKWDQELRATRTKLCEEISRNARMYRKIEKLEEDVDRLNNLAEFYKDQMLRLQRTGKY